MPLGHVTSTWQRQDPVPGGSQDPVPGVFPALQCLAPPWSQDSSSEPAREKWASRHWAPPPVRQRGGARGTHYLLCLQLHMLGPVIIWEGAVRKFVLSSVPSLTKAPPQKNLGVALPSPTPPPRSHPAAGRAESSTDESGLSHLTPPPYPSGVCPGSQRPLLLYTLRAPPKRPGGPGDWGGGG